MRRLSGYCSCYGDWYDFPELCRWRRIRRKDRRQRKYNKWDVTAEGKANGEKHSSKLYSLKSQADKPGSYGDKTECVVKTLWFSVENQDKYLLYLILDECKTLKWRCRLLRWIQEQRPHRDTSLFVIWTNGFLLFNLWKWKRVQGDVDLFFLYEFKRIWVYKINPKTLLI